jgi:hypothetical protein
LADELRLAAVQHQAMPTLLPTFFLATLAIVAAVVLIARVDSDAADFAAIALVIGTLGLLMHGLWRRLDDEDDEPSSEGDR